MLKSWAVKAIMLLTITHLIIYSFFLNNEEAGNVYLFFFNIYDQGWLNPIT